MSAQAGIQNNSPNEEKRSSSSSTVNQSQPPIGTGGTRVYTVCKHPWNNKRTYPNKNDFPVGTNQTNNKAETTASESREELNRENAFNQNVVDI